MADNKVLVEEVRRAAQHRRVKSRVHREVVLVEREVAVAEREAKRGRTMARTGQFVDYAFGALYVLLGIRLLLALIAARPGAAFVQWIRAATDPLAAPFKGILPNLTSPDGYTLALPVLFAILMYAILHLGVKSLLRLIGERRVEM